MVRRQRTGSMFGVFVLFTVLSFLFFRWFRALSALPSDPASAWVLAAWAAAALGCGILFAMIRLGTLDRRLNLVRSVVLAISFLALTLTVYISLG